MDAAPRPNPTQSKEVQNPLEIAGFFLPFVRRRAIAFIKIRQLWGPIKDHSLMDQDKRFPLHIQYRLIISAC